MGLKSNDKCPYRSRTEQDPEKRGGGNVTTEAETGVTWSQATEHLELPEAGRDREWSVPKGLQREHGPANTLISNVRPPEV